MAYLIFIRRICNVYGGKQPMANSKDIFAIIRFRCRGNYNGIAIPRLCSSYIDNFVFLQLNNILFADAYRIIAKLNSKKKWLRTNVS